MHQHRLPGPQAGMVEQRLPGRQPGHRQRGTIGVVDGGGQRCQVACLDCHVLGQGAVAGPVGEAEHPLTHGQPGGPHAELGHLAGDLVAGDHRAAVPPGPVFPGTWPVQLAGCEPGRVHPDHHVVLGGVRVGSLLYDQCARPRLCMNAYCPHRSVLSAGL
jgi:hypothetical protein